MSSIFRLACILFLVPTVVMAGECRIEHRHNSWLSYLKDCPKDVSDVVFRHSLCEYAYDTFKDTRTSEKVKKDTQEVLYFRKCDALPCDKEKIVETYKDDATMLSLINEAYSQMDLMYHAEMNRSPYDAPCNR